MKFLSTAFLTFNLLPSITIALEAAEVVFDPTLFTLDAASDGAKTHYGDPSEGCMKDEHAFQIQGVAGMICAPKCTAFRPCPSDVPKGVTAMPQCALKSSDGNTYCALLCQPSEDEDEWPVAKLLRKSVGDWAGIESAGGQCGDASCQAIGGAGICTYSN